MHPLVDGARVRHDERMHFIQVAACATAVATIACDGPLQSTVVLDNDYPPASSGQLVVYRAQFQTAFFDAAVIPGASSSPQTSVPTSGDTAYAVLAPGWDAASDAEPTSLIVVESNQPFAAPASAVTHIAVSDSTFQGRCDAGSFLTQEEADLVIAAFFSDVFTNLAYDAASCWTTVIPDGGAN